MQKYFRLLCMKVHHEYILHEQLRNLLDSFTSLLDIRIAVFSSDMSEIHAGLSKPSCGYCKFLRGQCGVDAKCRTLDRRMFMTAMKRKRAVVYKCHGNLTEAIFPLMNENEVYGFMMIGQFRTAAQKCRPAGDLSAQKKKRLTAAYARTPVFGDSQVKHILDMCHAIVELIVSKGLMSDRQWKNILPVMDHVRLYPETHLSLEAAAELAGVSRSSVSHLFKKITCRSFKRYQLDHLLDAAETMMRKYPERSISEISRKMGYDDPFYFSRMFKKHRGISPMTARKSYAKP